MSRDGNGNFSVINEFTSGTTILASEANANFADIATALTASIAKDGQTVPTADLPMGSRKHTNVGAATTRTHYARTDQVQDGSLLWGGTAGGTATALTITMSPGISAYAAGQCYGLLAGSNSTGAATIDFGPGAKAIKKLGADIVAGDWSTGDVLLIEYDGTDFQLLHPRRLPVSSQGDLIIGGSGGVESRLAIGASGRLLKSNGTTASWAKADGTSIALGSDAQGDIMYFNGTSWARLGAGTAGQALISGGAGANPAWGDLSETVGTATTTSGASQEVTGIPSWANRLEVGIRSISFSSSSSHLQVQLGTASAYVTSGYVGRAVAPHITSGVTASSAFETMGDGAAASTFTGTLHFVREPGTNVWQMDSIVNCDAPAATFTGAVGHIAMPGTVTRIKFLASTGNFDAGSIGVMAFR